MYVTPFPHSRKYIKKKKTWKRANVFFAPGEFVSNLCKGIGKHIVQLPVVVPFPIIPAYESLVGLGRKSLQ